MTLKFTPNPTRVCIWVQVSSEKPTDRPHPKQHWESDITPKIVSDPCVVKIGVPLAHGICEQPWDKIHRLLYSQIFAIEMANMLWVEIIITHTSV